MNATVPDIESLPPLYQQLLGEIAYILLQDGEVAFLVQSVFDKLRDPLQLDIYVHYLVEGDGQHLSLASYAGDAALHPTRDRRLEFGESISGTVARTAQPLYVPEMQSRTDTMTSMLRSRGMGVYACEPLIARTRLVGTLAFGSRQRDHFLPDDLALFRMVARQLGLAIDRRLQNAQFSELVREAAAGRMSATLAHEIRNPLEALSNLVYLLRTEPDAQSRTTLLNQTQQEVDRLAATVRNTLDQFRGKRQPAAPAALDSLIATVIDEVRLPNNVPIEHHLEPQLRASVNATEFRQVLVNLLVNAAHFTPPGKPVHLTLSRLNDQAEIRVIDQGPGISEDTRQHIFEPYFSTRKNKGTGLGLWFSRELIHAVGGTITFHSEPETQPGTEFLVTLPLLTDALAPR